LISNYNRQGLTISQDKKTESRDITSGESTILSQWRRERPDIDPAPMAMCGEIWRFDPERSFFVSGHDDILPIKSAKK